MEVQRQAVATNSFPLWEYEREKGRFAFTHPVDNPTPMEDYLNMLGKFRHLSEEQIDHHRKTVATRINLLKAIAEEGIKPLKVAV